MITEIKIPSPQSLQPLLDEALAGSDDKAALVKRHVDSIYETLKAKPLMYRNYGAYWWSIKRLMKEHGYDLGSDDEAITAEHFTYDDPALLVCAAWAYQNHQLEMGYILASIHHFPLNEDIYEYSIEDVNLEAWAVNATAAKN